MRDAREYVRDQGGLIFTARDLRGLDNPAQLAPVLAASGTAWLPTATRRVYLSLDIDCLDPAFAPGTGTPEPGGMSTNQVLSLLEELADLPLVGMDCVEVAPAVRPCRTDQPGRRPLRLDLPLRQTAPGLTCLNCCSAAEPRMVLHAGMEQP